MNAFTKNFWAEKIGWRHNGDIIPTGEPVVRYQGKHFILGSRTEKTPASCRGFHGARCTVTFLDGRVLTSVDVWHQGTIPDEYRADLPDNAVKMTWA